MALGRSFDSGKLRTVIFSEVLSQLPKFFQREQLPGAPADVLPLQHPGVSVRNEDRVQAGFQRGIDVGFRAVADHPRMRRVQVTLFHQPQVSGVILLLHDGGVAKESSQTGPVDFQFLFLGITLREERQIVAA